MMQGNLPPPFRLTADMIIRYYLSQIDTLEDLVVMATFKDRRSPMVSMTDIDPALSAWLGAFLLRHASEPRKEKAPVRGPSGSGDVA